MTEDGLDAALGRVGYALIFHPDLARSAKTGAIVDRVKALGVPVEVVTGTRENVEAVPR